MQKVHLIAIGGSAMHNLALALNDKGYTVSGSDDEINEPSRSRLLKAGLLPAQIGWFPEKITSALDAVILGMHARADNPELKRAQELGVKIYSYPEYIYQATKDKHRVVVGGSHGKTTITAMILHVAEKAGLLVDFLVGAQLEGFYNMVKLSHDAKFAVIEGDEYLASPIDRRPKFHLYRPHIAIISGIAWDHINVFPTFDIYLEQFSKFIDVIESGGSLVYCEADLELKKLVEDHPRSDIKKIPYKVPDHIIEQGVSYLDNNSVKIPLQVFGDHNLMNLNGALQVCREMNIGDQDFYQAIQSFKGAAKRLELVHRQNTFTFYKDFAHSPSKLKATTAAVRKQFSDRRLIACMELHTFSSLNEEFLRQYKGSMDGADLAIVYYNPHTIEHKKLKPISREQVLSAFGRQDLIVLTDSSEIQRLLKEQSYNDTVLLMMSSGNFDGIDFTKLAGELV